MYRKYKIKVIIAIAIALAFVMPGSAAFTNFGTFGVTSDSENTDDMENMVETSTNSDNIETVSDDNFDLDTEDTIVAEETINAMPIGNIIYVDDDNTDGPWDGSWELPYQFIQDGIDNAIADDTVYVFNGIYYENLNVDKQLNLIGQSKDAIIDGNGNNVNVVQITANGVNLDIFTIKSGNYGIYLYGISNCNISNCVTYDHNWYGIYIYRNSDNNNVIDCESYDNRYGISIRQSSYNNVINFNAHNNTDTGIYIRQYKYNNIINCSAYNNNNGIKVDWSPGYINNITNCNVYNNTNGIYFYRSSDCKLRDNAIYDNTYNLDISGYNFVSHFCHDIDATNTVNGKPIYYLVEESDKIIDETNNFGYLGIISCTNITAKNADVNGILVVDTTDSTIDNVSSHNSKIGIYIWKSSCDITNCVVYDNDNGIFLYQSSGNTISNCDAYNNKYGIQLEHSNGNNIINCNLYNNTQHGLYINMASANIISYSNMYNNSNQGIFIRGNSNDNEIMNCNSYSNTNYGINLDRSPRNYISNCTVYHNKNNFGIRLSRSSNSQLRDNVIYDNFFNLNVGEGNLISDYVYDIDTSNTVDGKPIYYLIGESDRELNETHNFGYLGLISCTNIIAKNADVCGVVVVDTTDSTIDNVDSHNNKDAIYLYSSSNNNIINCDAYDNSWRGIYLYYSSDNNIENCNAYNNSQHGIYISMSSEDDITNCDAYDNRYGIYLMQASNCNITNCDVYNNDEYGIYLYISPNCKLRDNTIYNNAYNLGIGGYGIDNFYHDIDTSNTINGKSILYLVEQSDLTFNGNFGYLGLVSCTNITAKNADVNGVLVINTTDSTVDNVNSHHYIEQGIYLWMSSNNNVINCDAYDNNEYGIRLDSSSDNNIENCNAYNNRYGIYLTSSSNNNISNCNAYDNSGYSGCGIYIMSSSNYNDIINCNAYNNEEHGINILYASNNNIITNCNTYNNMRGIRLDASNENNVINCDSHNNNNGIFINNAPDNYLTCNAFYDNEYNFVIDGDSESSFFQNIDSSNTVNGKHIYYLVDDSDKIIDETNDFGYLGIISCTNITAKNADVNGVLLVRTTDSTIDNINVHHSIKHGIYLWKSSNKNEITNCNVYYNNNNGIHLKDGSSYNNITNCNIYYNNGAGIYLWSNSDHNSIHHNNLINNFDNAHEAYCDFNTWDGGIDEGNYWSDYIGVDLDEDGIGDTPYIIPGTSNSQDNYPFMEILYNIPPTITDIQATPDVQKTTEPVNITCTVMDIWDMLDTVKVNITGPEGFTLEAIMDAKDSSYWYEDTYTTMGVYYYYIWAINTLGSESTSDTYSFIITDIDTPISTVSPLPVWTQETPFTVTATAHDPDLKFSPGVENVTLWFRYNDGVRWTDWAVYSIDEEEPWSWEITGEDGYYEFYSIAVDSYGNAEEPPSIADASTGLDTVKPDTTIILDPTEPDGENGWYLGNVIITIIATDDLSGVDSTWYKLDSGYWKLYSVPVTVSSEGLHTIQYYSVDKAGNKEDTKSIDFKIDRTPPVTTHEFEGVIGVEDWFVSNVTVTLSATDATSGVDYTKYKLDDGNWTTYTEPFDVTEDGEYTLYYCSVDLAGNTEPTNEVDFKIEHDIVPPVTTHEFNGDMGDNDWYTSNVLVILSAEDNSAGVDYTMYKLEDDVEWQEYTGSFYVTEDAEHTIEYYSVDKVGNEETVNGPFDFKIDQTEPTIDLDWDDDNSKLVADVSDETSGVAKVEFYVNGEFVDEATASPYECEVTNPKIGDKGQAIVFDNAGNGAVSEEIDAVSQGQSQSSSSTSAPLRILSWLFGLW